MYSKLVSYKRLSPNFTKGRNHKIDTITIHCVAGDATVEGIGATFAPTSRKASSNYGIDSKGRIGVYVEEENRSWCTSSSSNDNRAITIEVSNYAGADKGWPITTAAYNSLINLLVDVCQRYNISKLMWRGDKSLIGQVDKQNMTAHRWFANTDCPGSYIYSREGQIAADVNARLNKTTEEDDEDMVVRYKKLEEIPEYGKETIKKLMDKGIIKGNEDGLDLTEDMIRILVYNDRAGLYT